MREIEAEWKVHTPNLLKEIVNCSGIFIYQKPLNIIRETPCNGRGTGIRVK
jgi:hypothetical protein